MLYEFGAMEVWELQWPFPMAAFKLKSLMAVSTVLRIFLVLYGEWQDMHMKVRYTDVDYLVFSDAASLVASGRSPFERSTYRYSPLLAFLLVPNTLVHRSWGKFLFSAAGNVLQAAFWYGLVVHFRIYPIIYSLPILLVLDNVRLGWKPMLQRYNGRIANPPCFCWRMYSDPLFFLRSFLTKEKVIFGILSGSMFLLWTALFFYLYGWDFLDEALLYHLTRVDPRHNFSIYFYHIYLHHQSEFSILEKLISFLPQLLVQTVLIFRFSQDLQFCLFVQTVAFVAFNKVVTAQYFVWFFCLLPLILPWSKMKFKWQGILCILVWMVAQLHWLFWGYLLEFKGRNVLTQLWLASIMFLAANTYVLIMVICHHSFAPLFMPIQFHMQQER